MLKLPILQATEKSSKNEIYSIQKPRKNHLIQVDICSTSHHSVLHILQENYITEVVLNFITLAGNNQYEFSNLEKFVNYAKILCQQFYVN